ncbi:unnamed protein product [Cuscuta epithymum]|uniref:Uncharacterized protein n=1 Tax=Cuscuta epithymum TaxID=186058 RepID=A0AAV0DGY7_9ASTE|nr:unnamed protein product [Cuscuta epithymum]
MEHVLFPQTPKPTAVMNERRTTEPISGEAPSPTPAKLHLWRSHLPKVSPPPSSSTLFLLAKSNSILSHFEVRVLKVKIFEFLDYELICELMCCEMWICMKS